MRIFRLFAAALVALSLGACDNPLPKLSAAVAGYQLVKTATVSQSYAAALHSGLSALETATNGYINTCVQPANNARPGCDKPTVGKVGSYLAAVKVADNDLFNAIVAAQAAGAKVPVASTVYNAAADAANKLLIAKPA